MIVIEPLCHISDHIPLQYSFCACLISKVLSPSLFPRTSLPSALRVIVALSFILKACEL